MVDQRPAQQPGGGGDQGQQGDPVRADPPRGRRRERAEHGERDHRQGREEPGGRGRHPEPVADLGEHGPDADGGRPEVQREEDQPERTGVSSPRRRSTVSMLPVLGRCGTSRTTSGAPGSRRGTPSRRARVADPVAATRAMTVLHSTEPATVYLSLLARVDGLTVADVDTALYDERSLVKQLAMRRTLFVFPRDLLPAAWGSASARVADQLAARLAKELEAAGHAEDGAVWLDQARAGVVERAGGRPRPDRPGGPAAGADARGPAGARARHEVRGQRLAGAAGAHPARRGGHAGAGSQCRSLAAVEAALDADVRLARRRTSRRSRRGRLRRAGPPLAGDLRPRHRDRHRLVAGVDQDGGTPRARRPRGGRGVPRRRRHRLGAPRRRGAGGRRWSRGRRCCRCSTRR